MIFIRKFLFHIHHVNHKNSTFLFQIESHFLNKVFDCKSNRHSLTAFEFCIFTHKKHLFSEVSISLITDAFLYIIWEIQYIVFRMQNTTKMIIKALSLPDSIWSPLCFFISAINSSMMEESSSNPMNNSPMKAKRISLER